MLRLHTLILRLGIEGANIKNNNNLVLVIYFRFHWYERFRGWFRYKQ